MLSLEIRGDSDCFHFSILVVWERELADLAKIREKTSKFPLLLMPWHCALSWFWASPEEMHYFRKWWHC